MQKKIRRAEDLTTCSLLAFKVQTLTNMGLRKEFQALGNLTLHARLAT